MRYRSALTLFSIFTGFSSAAYASNKSDIQDLKKRVEYLESTNVSTCCHETGTYICTCDRDPVTGPVFFVSGEVLYWKVSEQGLTTCLKGVENSTGSAFVARSKHPAFNWHLGFRVDAGYNMCHDLWKLYATYTRLSFTNVKNNNLGPDRNPSIPGLPTIIPFWFNFASSGYNSVKSTWRVNFDQGDLLLARKFYVTDYLSLNPHVGLRTAWIRQKLNLDCRAVGSFTNLVDLNMKNNFWGFGVVGGLQTNWYLGCGFSIVSDAALSILDGHFDTNFNLSQTTSVALFPQLKETNHQNMAVLFTDLFLGLSWERMYLCDRLKFTTWLGWEQHIFFEQNQFLNNNNSLITTGYTLSDGNLNMNGITFGIEFEY